MLIASAVLWAGVLAVPFLPVAGAWKIGIGGGIAVVAEVAFWISAVILGREAVVRYRRYLDPRTWGKGAAGESEALSRNGNEPPTPSSDDDRGIQ